MMAVKPVVGPEMDAAIAEHVMGWKRHVCVLPTGSFDCWLLPPVEGVAGQVIKMLDDVHGYSYHMGAAWKVVEELRRNHPLEVSPDGDTGWSCQSASDGDRDLRDVYCVAATAPLAICIGALRAVGVEVCE